MSNVRRTRCATCNKPKLKISEAKAYREAKLAEDKTTETVEETKEEQKHAPVVKPAKPVIGLRNAVLSGRYNIRVVAGQPLEGLTTREVGYLRRHGFVE